MKKCPCFSKEHTIFLRKKTLLEISHQFQRTVRMVRKMSNGSMIFMESCPELNVPYVLTFPPLFQLVSDKLKKGGSDSARNICFPSNIALLLSLNHGLQNPHKIKIVTWVGNYKENLFSILKELQL